MNLIFLNIDGVLTTRKNDFQFSKTCVDYLLHLVEKTYAKVIICSSWKEETLEKTLRLLPERIRKHVLDQTPTLPGKRKGEEVRAYLSQHPLQQCLPNEDYVILDDEPESYLPFQRSLHLVITDINEGLTIKDLNKAMRILLVEPTGFCD